MKKIFILTLLLSASLFAKINVVTSYPYLAKITEKIGGSSVHVTALASARMDPHFIVPKPSLIPKLSRANLLIINGAGLEIGWLPPLLKRANNAAINPGANGFADASKAVRLIDRPKTISRAYGDVHPDGNPHFILDPHNVIPIAKLIAKKLSHVDPAHKALYQKNLSLFIRQWHAFLGQFDAQMRTCKGKKVVQYHELYNYLLKRYGIRSMATLEPLPGISPSSKHTMKVIGIIRTNHIGTILQDPYHEKKTARFIAKKTGAKVITLPQDTGAVKGTGSLESFYRTISKRLCH
ncbi:metal ABC transporter substrate-binding protein [Sulfurovum riftiae]|uniref:Metal ABC transporter substrate-binding protein n=1 Tax=Sulfurovum riftiae TaxID=1630136 RepID=A0A151CDY6_9BACT|nr:metal ABC transporter substrate-binding protein [Sulfurovum riftiae]KYJ85738.1 metal ABC transporter substrate-binding protein [Sulfurovum riftiae]